VVAETVAVAFNETVRCYIRLDSGTIESLVERCLSIAVWGPCADIIATIIRTPHALSPLNIAHGTLT